MSANRSRIPGPAIVGLADVFVGVKKPLVVVRASAKPAPGAKPASAKLPAGTKVAVRMASGGKNREGHGQAKAVAFNALKAGDKALAAAKKAATSIKNYGGAVKLGCHAPLVPLFVAGVDDCGQVVLGAATRKPLTPRQTAAVQKHTATVARTAAATRRLARFAKKAELAGKAAHAVSKQTTGAIAHSLQLKWPKGKTAVGAADLAYLDQYYAFVGAVPDPERPGYLTDGSLDPILLLGQEAGADPGAGAGPDAPEAGGDPGAGIDAQEAGAGAVTAPDGTVLYDPATDPQVVPLPPRGGALSPEDAQIAWQHPPEDAIPYDGSRGLPQNAVGSWNVFYGSGEKSADGLWGIPGFLRGADAQGNILWMYNAPDLGDAHFHAAPREYQSLAMSGAPDAAAVSANSLNRGWGSIVANPQGLLAGLQYAIADKVWFWQGKNAPTWATAETDAKIAASNEKIRQANRATALVEAARMQKELAAQAEAKAKQEAANALAMSAAETQSQIVQKQVESQRSQLEVQQEKAELQAEQAEAQLTVQERQAEIQQQQAEAQAEARAQHALVTQADVWNKWAAAHPEEAVAQMQRGRAPGGPSYGTGDEGEGGGYDGGHEGGGYDFGEEDDGGGDLDLEDD